MFFHDSRLQCRAKPAKPDPLVGAIVSGTDPLA
jgi:hypothetical protein